VDLVLLVGSGIGLIGTWIALSCLIMIPREGFSRNGQTASHPLRRPTLRTGNRASCYARASHP